MQLPCFCTVHNDILVTHVTEVHNWKWATRLKYIPTQYATVHHTVSLHQRQQTKNLVSTTSNIGTIPAIKRSSITTYQNKIQRKKQNNTPAKIKNPRDTSKCLSKTWKSQITGRSVWLSTQWHTHDTRDRGTQLKMGDKTEVYTDTVCNTPSYSQSASSRQQTKNLVSTTSNTGTIPAIKRGSIKMYQNNTIKRKKQNNTPAKIKNLRDTSKCLSKTWKFPDYRTKCLTKYTMTIGTFCCYTYRSPVSLSAITVSEANVNKAETGNYDWVSTQNSCTFVKIHRLNAVKYFCHISALVFLPIFLTKRWDRWHSIWVR